MSCLNIKVSTIYDSSLWAVKTSDTFTRQILQVNADTTRVLNDEHPDY